MPFLKCGKKSDSHSSIVVESSDLEAGKKGCFKGRTISSLFSKKSAVKSESLKKSPYFKSNKTKAATITVATLVTLVVLGAIAAVLYAKFGHNASIESWMNNKFIPLFTDKLAPVLTKAIDWMKQGGQIPNWVPVALGGISAVSLYALLGLGVKHIDDKRTLNIKRVEPAKADEKNTDEKNNVEGAKPADDLRVGSGSESDTPD